MVTRHRPLWLTAVFATLSLAAAPVSAADNFYQGKTLTIIVPYGPGGGYDLWPRLMTPYLKQFLGAADVKVVNLPGGGGLVGTNAVYGADADGLTVGDTNAAGDVFAEMAKAPGVSFVTAKFSWLGRPDNDPHIIAVHPSGPYKSFDDIIALKGSKTVLKSLATGRGSSDYNSAVTAMNAFQVPFSMVAAFKGSSEEKATFLAGGGDTISVSASDIAELGGKATVVVLTATDPSPELPNIPTVVQLAEKHNLPAQTIDALKIMSSVMDLGHAFFAPPGVPADRLEALRSAFAKTFQDKDFLASVQKAGLYAGYAPADQLQQATENAFKHVDELTPLLKTN
jgi:tripartite-type tricarboxylate transporter receptor subunit TctC